MIVIVCCSFFIIEVICASYINEVKSYKLYEFDYDHSFHKLSEIEIELERLFIIHGDVIELIKLGKTHEDRDINAVIVSNHKVYGNIVVFECGIHSREWISISFCLWSINQLIKNRRLLSRYQFLIIPVLNPDGYAYTWEVDRLWRQNREFYNASIYPCFGLDINRNFATKTFCDRQVEQIPCGEQFCGPHPFSSAEALALSQYLWSIRHHLLAYYSFHSYSQYWAYPMSDNSSDTSLLEHLSKIGTDAIRLVYGTEYKVGPVDELMYRTSGTSTEWVKQELNVSIVFTIEMPPQWDNNMKGDEWKLGFKFPSQRIKPVCLELWTGIEAILDYLANSSNIKSPSSTSVIVILFNIIFTIKHVFISIILE